MFSGGVLGPGTGSPAVGAVGGSFPTLEEDAIVVGAVDARLGLCGGVVVASSAGELDRECSSLSGLASSPFGIELSVFSSAASNASSSRWLVCRADCSALTEFRPRSSTTRGFESLRSFHPSLPP